ncbi:MAG: hypothetical protein OEV49_03075 [candidate division Zixibacteria bacterium]|nr:hypothetical protein [candidate division Zixibacteria bacterium]MDH3939213.1 hypothetical protein [candidate division Zixibacteria bacterium]MDH4035396.1 hypothetical protein [candidate division Zixibacteria bacterium]
MLKSVFAVIVCLVVLSPPADQCRAEVNLGISIDEEGVKGFYLAIGEHFEVEARRVTAVKKAEIPDEEMPVVFFLAKRCYVSPSIIIRHRQAGLSWMDICLKYGLTAEIFWVDLKQTPGPPYGKAWGHFKKKKKNKWGSIRFTDIEIVNFVNLKFVSEHYGHSPDEVVKMRGKGTSFVKIHGNVKKAKSKKKDHAGPPPPKKAGKLKGKPKKR